MKRVRITKSVAIALSACVLFASCSKDDNTPLPDPGNGGVLENNATLTGDITSNTTLAKGNTYFLKGGVHVVGGAVLTIQEGVTVKSDPNDGSAAYLLVDPTSKIEAVGTAEAPIVFTSGKASPQAQDWGGIILTGKAPINVTGGTALSEMGQGISYGGTDANHSSGTLKYVRAEYTGKKSTSEKEHNGFTFEGVGAGTTVENIAVYHGGDDGIEFFGGTVNVKYAVVYGAQDDSFDWTYGWKGKGQFWVAVQGDILADRGIEADNNGSNRSASPFSEPTLSNVTLVGSLIAQTGDDLESNPESGKTRAIKLREGTKGKLYNFVTYGFSSGVEVEHDETLANMEAGSLIFANSTVYGPKSWSFKNTAGAAFVGDKLFSAEVSNTVDALVKPAFITGKYVGTTEANALDPKTLDAWFTSAKYQGAVSASDNWVAVGNWAKID
jgi:hypothetical protein